MKWWKKALIASVIWIALLIGIGFYHTEVVLAGKLTPEQDDAMARRYGQICGAGLGVFWVLLVMRRKGRGEPGSER